MTTKKELTAPCGMDCFNCPVYVDNITTVVKYVLALRLRLSPRNIPCTGCRKQQGCRLHWNTCETLDCVKAKGIEFCFECAEFPCSRLQPAADGAAKYPHNMKLYNLCRIKKIGVEQWAEKEAGVIRRKYFKGKFVVGSGPVVKD